MKKEQSKKWHVWVNNDGIMGQATYCRQGQAEMLRTRDLEELEKMLKKAKDEKDEKGQILLKQMKDNITEAKLYELKAKWGKVKLMEVTR